MNKVTHELTFEGSLLKRGFWLYVWEIKTPANKILYYVGRTGDSSSTNAQSPFNRMGQHLSVNDKSNVLRAHLKRKNVDPETCIFRLVAHGPILKEALTKETHREQRDIIAALEKALAEAMAEVGYEVINTVNCLKCVDESKFAIIRSAFASYFPRLQA